MSMDEKMDAYRKWVADEQERNPRCAKVIKVPGGTMHCVKVPGHPGKHSATAGYGVVQ